LWRIQGYTAYGFEDNKFKYGISGKWMIDKKNRIILSGGNRRDVEQIGASLTSTNDVLGRSYASSGLFTTGANGKLTSINLTTLAAEIEPIKNVTLQLGFSYRTLESASDTFELDYYTDATLTNTKSKVTQSELNVQIEMTPKKKTIGYGVERRDIDSPYSRIFINYGQGFKGFINSDFDYQKIQIYYKQPVVIGAIGRSNFTMELGKTFGQVPLGLMSVVPGNQTLFIIDNTFSNLNFYEFVADQYATLQWEHNFQGKIFWSKFFRVPKNFPRPFGPKILGQNILGQFFRPKIFLSNSGQKNLGEIFNMSFWAQIFLSEIFGIFFRPK
jgi:hypothetical protein